MGVLKLSFIYGYLGEKLEETSRALDEGEEIEKSDHISDFGITQKYEMKTLARTIHNKRKNLEFQMLAAVYHKGDHGQYCYTLK